MDLKQYLDIIYRWAQKLYSSEWVEVWIHRIRRLLEGRSAQEIIGWMGKTLLWVLALGLALDWVLYWTREDQVLWVRRLWRWLRRVASEGYQGLRRLILNKSQATGRK
jgi:hypothetical protein